MPHLPPDGAPTGASPDTEIAAMRRVVAALKPLDVAARARVASWAFDRFAAPLADAAHERRREPSP